MLFDIKQGKADAVVVYKLDRLSRSQKDTLNLIEDYMLAAGVDFISINENFDTSSPFGRAMIGILSVFAQLEKDQIAERFTLSLIHISMSIKKAVMQSICSRILEKSGEHGIVFSVPVDEMCIRDRCSRWKSTAPGYCSHPP